MSDILSILMILDVAIRNLIQINHILVDSFKLIVIWLTVRNVDDKILSVVIGRQRANPLSKDTDMLAI